LQKFPLLAQDISIKNINRLAIPALIAGVAEPILSITDTAIIGNMDVNATESLAAVGIVGAFISMLVWVFGQIRSAISSILSQYLGANKIDEVKELPAQAIAIILLGSFLVILLTYPISEHIFRLYNAKDLVLDYCVDYFNIRIFGFPFALLVFAVFGIFRGLQNTFYPMIIAIIGTIINIVLDVVLIYGIEGYIPAMHIKGAAYASVIAQASMAVISIVLLLRKTFINLRIRFPFHPEIKRLLGMVGNLFIRTIALNIALYLATAYATSYGKEYIAAYTITINLWLLAAFMIDGFASAGNILSGKLLGAKQYGLLIKLSNRLLVYGLVTGVIMAGIGFLLYNFIGGVFTKETPVLTEFYTVFWLVLLSLPVSAITFIFDGMFKGMGKMKYLRNVLILSTGLVFLPSLLIFDYLELKLYAIWLTFTFWIIARGAPLILNFRKTFIPLATADN
jgi:putative MATE family efflux protein